MRAKFREEAENCRRKEIRNFVDSSRNISLNYNYGNGEITFETLGEDQVVSLHSQGKLHALDDEKTKNIVSFFGGISLCTELLKLSTGNLVRCDVPIEMLTNAKDGSGMLGIIRDKSGKLVKQARFTPVGGGAANPLIIFQVMSMATGQYYMHTITNRLKNIEGQLSHIIKTLETDKQAIRNEIYSMLIDYCNMSNSDFIEQDINRLFEYEDRILRLEKHYGPIDVLKNVSAELRISKILEQVNNNYDKVIEKFLSETYFQYTLSLLYFNLMRAYSALEKPQGRFYDAYNKFIKYSKALEVSCCEFQKSKEIADRFVTEIESVTKFPRIIFYDDENTTKKLKTEFYKVRDDKKITNLLEGIRNSQMKCHLLIEKMEGSELCISTISN